MNHGGRRRRRRRFVGLIPARPAAVGHENLPVEASGCPLPPKPAHVAGGWRVADKVLLLNFSWK